MKTNSVWAFAVAAGLIWIAFVAASLSPVVIAGGNVAVGSRNVYVNNVYVGNLELFNLVGNRGINCMFHPVNNDLNIVGNFHLNWLQVWNRPNNQTGQYNTYNHPNFNQHTIPNSQGIDPPNGGYNYQPGGSDNQPFYYANNDHHGNGFFSNGYVLNRGNYWIGDWPGALNGFSAEKWLVTSVNGNIRRLVGFNMGFEANGGVIDAGNLHHPNFINESQYNTQQWNSLFNGSGFNNEWRVFSVSLPGNGRVSLEDAYLGEYTYSLWVDDLPIYSVAFEGIAEGTGAYVTPEYADFWMVETSPGLALFSPMDPFAVGDVIGGFILDNPSSWEGQITWRVDEYGDAIAGPAESPLSCPPDAIPEGEPTCYDEYIDTYNSGCNADPTVFTPILSGTTVCGESGTFLVDSYPSRDTDWYEITLDQQSTVIWTVTAEFPVSTAILGPGSFYCEDYITYADGYGYDLEEVETWACLEAGTYWLFVAPQDYSGVPCGAAYIAVVSTVPLCTPPENDECWSATPLAMPYSSVSGTTIGATLDPFAPCPNPQTSPGVWYSVVGTGHPIIVSMCGLANWDARMTVFCGEDCGNLICVDDVDDACDLQPEVIWCSEFGREYLILIHGYGSHTGSYELMAASTYDMECDDYPNCTPGVCDPVDDLTAILSDDGIIQIHCTAPQEGSYYLFSTVNPNNDGDPDFGEDPDWIGGEVMEGMAGQELIWDIPPGTEDYRNFVVEVECQQLIPPNDNCSNPIEVSEGIWPFSTIGATTDGPVMPEECEFSGQIASSVWFAYYASCSGTVVIDVCDSSCDTKLAVFDNYEGYNCDMLTFIACNDDNDFCGINSLKSQVEFDAEAGHLYCVCVGGYGGAQCEGYLSIACPVR